MPPMKPIWQDREDKLDIYKRQRYYRKGRYGHQVEGFHLSTNAIRLTNSSFDPPTSKKSSTTVVRTPFLAHEMRASDNSEGNMVAAAER
jgi:hypothetical protein